MEWAKCRLCKQRHPLGPCPRVLGVLAGVVRPGRGRVARYAPRGRCAWCDAQRNAEAVRLRLYREKRSVEKEKRGET